MVSVENKNELKASLLQAVQRSNPCTFKSNSVVYNRKSSKTRTIRDDKPAHR